MQQTDGCESLREERKLCVVPSACAGLPALPAAPQLALWRLRFFRLASNVSDRSSAFKSTSTARTLLSSSARRTKRQGTTERVVLRVAAFGLSRARRSTRSEKSMSLRVLHACYEHMPMRRTPRHAGPGRNDEIERNCADRSRLAATQSCQMFAACHNCEVHQTSSTCNFDPACHWYALLLRMNRSSV